MKRPQTHEFVTIPKAQRLTGLGRRQFQRAINSGELSVFDVGSWPRVRWSEVLAWVEASRRITGDRRTELHDERERT